MSKDIIFVSFNIYEAKNGVSIKYVNFIDFLLNKGNINITLFTTFINNENYKNIKKRNNLKIVKTKGLITPFYKSVKIPTIKESTLKEYIKKGNEIIIFNGEFIWLYDILYNLKKKYINLKLYPNMHTDYIFYENNIYSKYKIFNLGSSDFFNHLDNYLEKNIFTGIIVTGESLKNKYLKYTNSVFNANEVNLNIFNTVKKDFYINKYFNIIYTGRIAKEKNIEEVLDCCMILYGKYNFYLNIIGDGPYLEDLKTIIDLEYSKIKSKIIFYGSMNHGDINKLYQTLDNRIYLFTSISETFGKTPMEAGSTGIPIFIKKCENTNYLYINKKNAFLFDNKNEFLESFEYFINMDNYEKDLFIKNSINNIKKYDQQVIFNDFYNFLISQKVVKPPSNVSFYDMLSFNNLVKLVNCTGNIMAD